MVGWHHRLNRHGFGSTPGVGDGQGGLVCCGSWGRKESDMTERLNKKNIDVQIIPLLWGTLTNTVAKSQIVGMRPDIFMRFQRHF